MNRPTAAAAAATLAAEYVDPETGEVHRAGPVSLDDPEGTQAVVEQAIAGAAAAGAEDARGYDEDSLGQDARLINAVRQLLARYDYKLAGWGIAEDATKRTLTFKAGRDPVLQGDLFGVRG
ncbi:MAG: hypothetical protein ACYDAY_11560 [Candidatus Dormibacteria bacterium]